ncbi:hypothetical protein M406DRAFT_47487 [Cryphonectria parasitica EP155]|uniref:RRM domain-containing protein n=1 Tax=Cryphonectria parasitica (strain ATCC 38755 / EP155) TaxID=660469 RepID=A0A9P5CK39_CRYP1|nr:uncharacterized protein M406DRAFT_47487 [Cryphonectria parasitica EP155]KAF3760566.1 hypothetical protein M406DRAFT_47487 [Cryphonectria parasitica EP155]
MSSSSSSPDSTPRASPDPAPRSSSSSKKRKVQQPEIEVDINLPEPPSKKAKRALKKGKPLPPKPSSDDEDNENEGTASSSTKKNGTDADGKAKKERSPFGVWIGNLRFTVTRDELRRWLVDNSGGSITDEAITRVHVPPSKPKGQRGGGGEQREFENKGFAYVDFTTYEATVAAIALSETEWYRRKLLIKDATSFEGRPEEHKHKKAAAAAAAAGATADGADGAKAEDAASPASLSRKVFVGNMSFQTTEEDVRELFAKCGEIEWVKVATFEDSGKCKGYGWVKFKEAASTEWAVKGFMKIREVEETEEDFMDPAQEKKVKTRKWWVNTLHGRRLKIEHAEDDQTRYKKRFGRPKDSAADAKGARQQNRPNHSQSRHNNNKNHRQSRDDAYRENVRDEKGPAGIKSFGTDISVARLTGAAVKPEGKKITFD